MIGSTISHYRIRELLGEGGMGEVYLAEDFSLNRLVALKILPKQFVADEDRLHRFIREAKTASAISHSGVAHIYEIGEAEGTHFIAMEYVEGSTLAKKVEKGPLEYHQVISITLELASALQAAHSKGIIHRDIKPSNVMITSSGAAKLLDFGLSKVTNEEKDPKSWLSTLTKTQSGLVLGTIPYMSPEQLRGLELDHRTDFFSLGTLLHQISTGRHPFQENTAIGIAQSILNEESIPVHQINNKIPTSFSKIVSKLLEKNREDRYQNVADILEDLKRVELDKTEGPKWLTVIRKPAVAFLLLLGLIAISAVFIRTVHHSSKVRWARDEALLEITRLIDQGKYSEAVELGNEAQKFIPEDPLLKSLWSSMSITVSIQTRPSGAEISTEDYESPSDKWKAIGISPISELRIPKGYTRWKITKSGFRPLYVVIPRAFWETEVQLNFLMEPESEIPSGMTRIPGLKSDSLFPLTFTIMPVEEDYWMDQFEVSNKEFKKFVDSSGYQNSKYWRVPFVKDGKELRFEEAMNYFHDSTGRPGPLHWEVGNYPRGEDGYPVTGVSWYEAAAYAEFAGKSLPTIHHWMRAAGDGMNYEIIRFSNFNSNGPILASDVRSMNPFGNYNMAGNVKEWCWNESDTGTRFILGGSYLEPVYKFLNLDHLDPFTRLKTNGFRCVKYVQQNHSKTLFEPFRIHFRNYEKEKPVDDHVFEVLKTFYSYDKGELNYKLESTEVQSYLKKEKVSFDAAYGRERMFAYLFFPLNRKPPYQTVIYFPGSGAEFFSSSQNIGEIEYSDYLDFLVRGGRAVVYPIYKGTFERGGGPQGKNRTADEMREWRIQCVKDVSRTLDYLEERNEIDKNRIAYYGYSWGAGMGGVVGAVENRFKTMILLHGGLPLRERQVEIDPINFVPRIRIPVLMINGKYDSNYPVESSQKPMFRLLETPETNKVHLLFETGHTSPRSDVVKIVLDWLDRYLGPA